MRLDPPHKEDPRYAVAFRVHFWDDYARRQLQRLRAQVRHGDIFVLADTTKGPIPGIDHDRIVSVTEEATSAMGLIAAGTGPTFWFNGDYPLYYFADQITGYDFVLCYEYDVVVDFDLDDFVAKAARRGADFVALTKGAPPDQWTMRYTCEDYYPPDAIIYKLFSFSLFSARALDRLRARRLTAAGLYSPARPESWPYCEGFIATELDLAGFKSCELSEFVDVSQYDYWPPYVESDMPDLMRGAITHPVLDRCRYVESLFRYPTGVRAYFDPGSLIHRKLRRLDGATYVAALASSFFAKALRSASRRAKGVLCALRGANA